MFARVFPRRALAALAALLLLAESPPLLADGGGVEASGAESALPKLGKLAPITPVEPTPEAVRELGRIVDLLTSPEARAREDGKAAIEAATSPAMVGAVRVRVQEIRASLDRDAAPKVLGDARRAGRKALKAEKKGSKDRDDDGDWLDFLLAEPRPKNKTWRHLVELVAMNRVLAAVGTTPAVRELIAMHAYFGDLLRIDLQRQVGRLKDKAVPALIEARQHDAKLIQRWAGRQLDALGKAIPGEAVSTSDTAVLADVLRAYGRTKELDAVRVILSFSNSERLELREAAREALGTIGEPALWQLREAYLSMTGDKPPRDWSWERIARELFASFDRSRLAEVHKTREEGLALAKKGDHAAAIERFDRVLARAPLLEGREELAASYAAVGRARVAEDVDAALVLLRKARRLDPKAEEATKLEAEIAYCEGMLLLGKGTPDRLLFERALELDPGHERAREALASLRTGAVVRQGKTRNWAAAGAIGTVAVGAMLWLWRGRRRNEEAAEPVPPPS